MSYPADVLLPLDAKYYGFVDNTKSLNNNWDIVWSFSYALTGMEHAFCTFLTTTASLISAIPGHYLGYLKDSTGNTSGSLAIAFDSTGYFALSNSTNPGLAPSAKTPNSLIIRDPNNTVVTNEELSNLNTSFFLASSAKSFQTLRFRLTNAGRMLRIDFKTDNSSYSPIISKSLTGFDVDINKYMYVGLTFCSPISSDNITPSTFYLKNFTVEGLSAEETQETVPFESIYPQTLGYTEISDIELL
jgi:hypothetical protein